MSPSNYGPSTFFAHKMTNSHDVTHRHRPRLGSVAGLSVLIIVTGAFAWPPLVKLVTASADDPPASQDGSASIPVRVGAVPLRTAGPSALIQSFTGIVKARRTSTLAAKITGRIQKLNVDMGDHVQAGRVLCELETDQLVAERSAVAANLAAAEATLAELHAGPRVQDIQRAEFAVSEAEAHLEFRKASHRRMAALRQSATVSVEDYDQSLYAARAARATLSSAQESLDLLHAGTRQEKLDMQQATVAALTAQLRHSDVQLAEARIVAPYNGHIQIRHLDEGAVVTPGQAILEIAETDALEVHVGLPPELATSLDTSQLTVTRGNEEFVVSVDRLAPQISERTRTREVVLTIDSSKIGRGRLGKSGPANDSSDVIPVGSAVDVQLQVPTRDVGAWLPTSALTAGPRGLWAVLVAEPIQNDSEQRPSAASVLATHIVQRRPLELLRSQGHWSQIRGPVGNDELVIVEGTHLVVPGQSITCEEKIDHPDGTPPAISMAGDES